MSEKATAIYTYDGFSSMNFIPRILQHTGYKVIEVDTEIELINTINLLPNLILIHYPKYGYPSYWDSLQTDHKLNVKNFTKEIPIIILAKNTSEPKLQTLEVDSIVKLPIDLNIFIPLLKSYLPD